jgi:hypothetical protein
MQVFELPTDEAWKEFIAPLRLSAEQAQTLKDLLFHVRRAACRFNEWHVSDERRKAMVRQLNAFRKAISKLREIALQQPEDLRDALPVESLKAIGLTVSPMPTGLAGAYFASEPAERLALGLEQGPILLAHALKQIGDPIDAWLKAQPKDEGGRPPDRLRESLLTALAAKSEAIIGRRATASRGGPFLELCTAVFHACEVSPDGLEAAVERALSVKHE